MTIDDFGVRATRIARKAIHKYFKVDITHVVDNGVSVLFVTLDSNNEFRVYRLQITEVK